MARTDQRHIAILGAGPVGIEAGLYAARLGMAFTLYEKGEVADHVQQWGHVRLFSPFRMNCTSLGLQQLREELPNEQLPGPEECIPGHRHREEYLKPLAGTKPLRDCIESSTEVVHVGRRNLLKHHSPGGSHRAKQPFLLYLRKEGKEWMEEADIILDCTGTYSLPRWLGDGGIPALGEQAIKQEVAQGLEDVLGAKKSHYAGKTTLVLGGGFSAATTVCHLAKLAEEDEDTWVVWLARCSSTQPIKRIANDPLRERDRLATTANTLATRAEGNVEFHNQTVITELTKTEEGYAVHCRSHGAPRTWNVERIIANVGYSPNADLYRELQVHECYASLGPMNLAAALLKQSGGDCLAIGPQGAETLRNPEPDFYILGAKSYGRGSQFLLRTGFEQIREVFTLITGKKNLNLYQ